MILEKIDDAIKMGEYRSRGRPCDVGLENMCCQCLLITARHMWVGTGDE